jgi:hypothetical protein
MSSLNVTGAQVWHTLTRGSNSLGHFATDLAYIDGHPTLIFEWKDTPNGSIPIYYVKIDARYLHEINWPQAKYMYELPVDDPRPEQ